MPTLWPTAPPSFGNGGHHKDRNRRRAQYAICNGSRARCKPTMITCETHHNELCATILSNRANHVGRAAQDRNVLATLRATELAGERFQVRSSGAEAHLVEDRRDSGLIAAS